MARDGNQTWYKHDAVIVWALILLYPVGLYLLWSFAPWRPATKFLLTAVIPIAVPAAVLVLFFRPAHPEARLDSLTYTPGAVVPVSQYPSFELTREVIQVVRSEDGSESITTSYHLSYTDADEWTYTLIESSDESAVVGDYQHYSDGRLTVVTGGAAIPDSEPGRGDAIPGPWFLRLDQVVSRARAGGLEYSITETDSSIAVSVETPLDKTEYIYDKESGAPLDYRLSVDGQMVEYGRATSLVVDGRIVR